MAAICSDRVSVVSSRDDVKERGAGGSVPNKGQVVSLLHGLVGLTVGTKALGVSSAGSSTDVCSNAISVCAPCCLLYRRCLPVVNPNPSPKFDPYALSCPTVCWWGPTAPCCCLTACHQVNIVFKAQVVWTRRCGGRVEFLMMFFRTILKAPVIILSTRFIAFLRMN